MSTTATIEKTKKSSKINTKSARSRKKANSPTTSKAKKTATISMRVEPNLKKEAEEVCARTGLSLTNAIDLFLYQIVRTQGIPVDISNLPAWPKSISLDLKSREEFLQELRQGINDIENGKVFSLDEIKDDIKGLYDD